MSARRVAVEIVIVALGAAIVAWAALADDVWFQTHWMRYYCVVDARALGRAHAARGLAVVTGALVVFGVRPRAGRWLARRSPGALARAALPSVLAALLALAVTEGVLRVARSRHGEPPPARYLRHTGAETFDVPIAGRTVRYVLNADGVRTRDEDDVLDPRAPTVLVSGESVVLGYGLDYDETIPARITAATGVQTVNLGMSGIANDEALDRLQRFMPRFERPTAVVSFVVTTWLERNVAPHRPRMALDGDGRLVSVPPRSDLLLRSPLLGLFRDAVGYHDATAVEITRALLRETARYIRSRGAFPLFVVTECGPRCITPDGAPPWLARRLVEGLDARTVDLVLEPGMTLPNDIHPNAAGDARYAEAILRALREAGVVLDGRSAPR